MPTNIDSTKLWEINRKIQEYTEEMLQQDENSDRRGQLNTMLKELADEQLILIEKIDKPSPSQPT